MDAGVKAQNSYRPQIEANFGSRPFKADLRLMQADVTASVLSTIRSHDAVQLAKVRSVLCPVHLAKSRCCAMQCILLGFFIAVVHFWVKSADASACSLSGDASSICPK